MRIYSGKAIDVKEAEKFCTPFVKNKDLGVNKSYTGAPLDPEQIAYPCGFKGKQKSTQPSWPLTILINCMVLEAKKSPSTKNNWIMNMAPFSTPEMDRKINNGSAFRISTISNGLKTKLWFRSSNCGGELKKNFPREPTTSLPPTYTKLDKWESKKEWSWMSPPKWEALFTFSLGAS